MSHTTHHSDGIVEECVECGRERPHDVSIDILTERDREENAEFSREPYRITECRHCGASSRRRMNDA
jgi:hypothetical protein